MCYDYRVEMCVDLDGNFKDGGLAYVLVVVIENKVFIILLIFEIFIE